MRRVDPGGLILSLGVVALGIFLAVETALLPPAPGYARVGPRLVPAGVAAALCAVGLALVMQALRGGWRPPEDRPTLPTDWWALGLISAGLIAQILLIERLGFVVASSLLFVFVAGGFGSRRPIRDAAIALALSSVTYLGFTRGLDLTLPAGPFGGLF